MEPFLRRRWPQSLISWTRLLAGDAHDSLVGGHILLGIAFAVVLAVLTNALAWSQWQASGKLATNSIANLDGVLLARLILGGLIAPAAIVMGFLFIFILLRLVLRNTWGAGAAAVVLLAAPGVLRSAPAPAMVFGLVRTSVLLGVSLRFGMLPGTLLLMIGTILEAAPLTSDFSAWYTSKGLIVAGLVLALAVWSFRHALGGRKILKDDFLDV